MRIAAYIERQQRTMSELQSLQLEERDPMAPRSAGAQARAVGSPLSVGGSNHRLNGSQQEPMPAHRFTAPLIREANQPRQQKALGNGKAPDEPSGLQKAVNTIRMVVPIVQKILPLLDGNIGTAVSNLIAPRPPAPPVPPPPPPAPKVDLAPIEHSLAELQTQHRGLREQVIEQNTSLKRVEDQLGMVREATDRNTLEQQELLEDLKAFSTKVRVVALIGLGVLAAIFALNLILYLHIQRLLP